jgi:hypothetical protein
LIHRHNPNNGAQLSAFDDIEVPEYDAGSHDTSDDEENSVEQATVGVAWPMDRIEPNGIPSSKFKVDSQLSEWRLRCVTQLGCNLVIMSCCRCIVLLSRKQKKLF